MVFDKLIKKQKKNPAFLDAPLFRLQKVESLNIDAITQKVIEEITDDDYPKEKLIKITEAVNWAVKNPEWDFKRGCVWDEVRKSELTNKDILTYLVRLAERLNALNK